MKKTLLRVASFVMMLAMVLTALVIPNESAKAADKEMELVVLLPESETRVAKVLLDLEWNGAGLVPDGTKLTNPVGWTRDMYTFTKEASANVYKIKLTGTVDAVNNSSLGAKMQFVFVNADGEAFDAVKFELYDTTPDNVNAYINNDKLYFNVTLAETATWATGTPLTEDPRAAKASDIIAVINEIGTVELSDACKGRIEAARSAYDAFTGNKADVTNYATLTAAEKAWSDLMTAAAGKITIHVKNDINWEKVAIYSWGEEQFGSWPGEEFAADENNEGWLTISKEITGATHIIFNNKGAGEQCSDWKYASAGEYWVVIAADKSYETSKAAPTGWSTGEVESETQSGSEVESESGSEKEDEIDKKGDFADAGIYMVVLMGAALVVVSAIAKKKMA